MSETTERSLPWKCLFCRMATDRRTLRTPLCAICWDQLNDFIWVSFVQITAASTNILDSERRNCNAPNLHSNFDGTPSFDQLHSICRNALACRVFSLDEAMTTGSARQSVSRAILIFFPS